jgi:8-hydroxy-5-deazaflavin:NADPH oxidoreductase
MKVAVLGTGMVGNAIASKLVALGHDVMMGSRTTNNAKATAWVQTTGGRGSAGTFADAAVFGEIVFNCTEGASSLAALRAAGAEHLEGKIVVDVANVLTPDGPGPESLGEQIQKAFPYAKVVKALNTMNCEIMVNPRRLPTRTRCFSVAMMQVRSKSSGNSSRRSAGLTRSTSATLPRHARLNTTCRSG